MNDYTRNPRESAESAVLDLFDACGEDPSRDGLRETPSRFAAAWAEWTRGYHQDPFEILKTFEMEHADEMIIVRDIPIFSKCEHHLADIFGNCSIGYISSGRVVGLSKLSRVADVFTRRLQTQERITKQIAECLMTSELRPRGVGVVVKARHMCMESRGISKQGHRTITSAMRGLFMDNSDARSEFMNLIK